MLARRDDDVHAFSFLCACSRHVIFICTCYVRQFITRWHWAERPIHFYWLFYNNYRWGRENPKKKMQIHFFINERGTSTQNLLRNARKIAAGVSRRMTISVTMRCERLQRTWHSPECRAFFNGESNLSRKQTTRDDENLSKKRIH